MNMKLSCEAAIVVVVVEVIVEEDNERVIATRPRCG